MVSPLCLKKSDPRMKDKAPHNKWVCAICAKHHSSQKDAQGHTLKVHGIMRSPPLCGCKANTFNSAKALWDHLHLLHNVDPRAVKAVPPVPLLMDQNRPMRTP